MKLIKSHRNQTPIEEWGNASLHLIGALISLFGLILMSTLVVRSSNPVTWISAPIFGVSLVMMFLASSFYHIEKNPKRKKQLKILDHCAIFFLIAGTYTPFMLLTLHNTFSYILLGVIWMSALLGTIYKIFFIYHYPKLSTFFYLIMGWMVVTAIVPLYQNLDHEGFYWLVAGGFSYTVGVIFYLWKRLYFSHVIWHLLVIVGCICHFLSIYQYVLTSST